MDWPPLSETWMRWVHLRDARKQKPSTSMLFIRLKFQPSKKILKVLYVEIWKKKGSILCRMERLGYLWKQASLRKVKHIPGKWKLGAPTGGSCRCEWVVKCNTRGAWFGKSPSWILVLEHQRLQTHRGETGVWISHIFRSWTVAGTQLEFFEHWLCAEMIEDTDQGFCHRWTMQSSWTERQELYEKKTLGMCRGSNSLVDV